MTQLRNESGLKDFQQIKKNKHVAAILFCMIATLKADKSGKMQ